MFGMLWILKVVDFLPNLTLMLDGCLLTGAEEAISGLTRFDFDSDGVKPRTCTQSLWMTRCQTI